MVENDCCGCGLCQVSRVLRSGKCIQTTFLDIIDARSANHDRHICRRRAEAPCWFAFTRSPRTKSDFEVLFSMTQLRLDQRPSERCHHRTTPPHDSRGCNDIRLVCHQNTKYTVRSQLAAHGRRVIVIAMPMHITDTTGYISACLSVLHSVGISAHARDALPTSSPTLSAMAAALWLSSTAKPHSNCADGDKT